MDLLEPFVRPTEASVQPPDPDSPSAARLLHTARWHAGLTQAELAQRAQTSQQAVARYEKGVNAPSLEILHRLLAACGMRLDLTLTPQPGLVDAPTRALLDRSPLDRLPAEFVRMLEDLVPVLLAPGLPALVTDRAAARLRGALVRVLGLEFWVDECGVDVAALEAALEQGGAKLWPVSTRPAVSPAVRPRLVLLEGGLHGREIRIRGMRRFGDHLGRATPLDAPFGKLLVSSVSDTALFWHARDRDHLALQRAVALRAERAGPSPL